jgi:hypothetical protein
MNLERCLAAVESALLDADATLSTDLGGHRETTIARLWRGQVLVDWEPDARAGDCLLRPDLLRRLVALDATAKFKEDVLRLRASGRVVAALSPAHADLVQQLGGAPSVELVARLRFTDDLYLGGDETYSLVRSGSRTPLLRLEAEVRVRQDRGASPRMSHGQT